jgi:type I restriction enzyme M protein
VRDGSQSPLRLGHFVQLRAAPSSAQFTTYFYNRTEGSSVRMVSYQYGPESELQEDVERFRAEFGALSRV